MWRRSQKCQNQPAAIWTGKTDGKERTSTLLCSNSPQCLFGQSQLEVKEEGNSLCSPEELGSQNRVSLEGTERGKGEICPVVRKRVDFKVSDLSP